MGVYCRFKRDHGFATMYCILYLFGDLEELAAGGGVPTT